VRKRKPKSVSDYLAEVSSEQRAALQKLRLAIHAAMPGAEECISYQLPAFRYRGKVQVWFGAGAKHCSFYPGSVVQKFQTELKKYGTSKGTIRFAADHPLPATLVKRLVKARIAQNAARTR